MKCVYYYKNKLIGNIRKLDDFLIEKYPYESKLGDAVFQNNQKVLYVRERLKKLKEQSNVLNEEYKRAREECKHYLDGEEMLIMKVPYIGVSQFLSGQRDENGNLYFPEFIEPEYWSRRFKAWAEGTKDSFTEDEIQILFNGDPNQITKVELGNINNWYNNDGTLKEEFGTPEQIRLKNLITEKWKAQAQLGTQMHNVLQLFFSFNKSGKRWFDVLEDPSTRGMHSMTFINELRNNGSISPEITNEHVLELIEYGFSLKEDLTKQLGDDLLFYPEFTLHADLDKTYKGRNDLKILGRVDLLVVDKNGVPHIIDYKTSPKLYEDYSFAKELGFTYQQATYERMLRRAKISTEGTKIFIAPLQMENFRKENGVWKFDHAKVGTKQTDKLKSLLGLMSRLQNLSSNLDEFIAAPMILNGTSQDIISSVAEDMQELFPKYGENKHKSRDQILDMLKKDLGSEPDSWINKETGNYEFTPRGSNYTIITKNNGPGSETKFLQAIERYYNGAKERNIYTTEEFISKLNDVLNDPEKSINDMIWPDGTSEWAKKILSKYLSGNWEIMQGDAQKACVNFGMILFKNNVTGVIEVVKISKGTNLKYQHYWGPSDKKDPNYTNLIAGCNNGIADIAENAKANSLMLKAVNGNIEMIEAMLVLNNIDFGGEISLGGIRVLDPHQSKITGEGGGLTARNKELMYSWKALQQFRTKKDDKYGTKIKMLSDVEVCYQEMQNILDLVGTTGYGGKFEKLKPAVSRLHDAIIPDKYDRDLAIDALTELRKILEDELGSFGMYIDLDRNGKSIHKGLQNYDQQYVLTIYQKISQAILDLSNVQTRQLLQSHGKYIDGKLSPKSLLNEGWSGYYVDNANNFKNQLLNQVTNIVLEGYQNARDTATSELTLLRKDVEQLKHDIGFSGIIEHTIGNQTSLYNGMTEYTSDGDLRFVNPWKNPEKLKYPGQREFLKKYILKINKTIHPKLTQEEIENKIKTNDIEFFQVPLVEASFASEISTDGWLGWLKNKLKNFSKWSRFKEWLRDSTSEFFSEELEQQSKSDARIFEAVNLLNKGITGNKRLEYINKLRKRRGDGFFERDVEKIAGQVIWAYSVQNAMEDRMPLLKSAYISLAIACNDQNYDFANEMTYFEDFVKNKVLKQSLVNENQKELKGAIGKLQSAASWMALAFSPVQFSYQTLEGIWKDAKLIITKPDGQETFTLDNMKDAAGIVYKDMCHISDDPTVVSALNSLYGINDMDNASFVENNSSNRHGIFNFFSKFAMKFSSRPDYYNRMTIFAAQMLKDGSFKAHKINSQGVLEYDYKEDSRFEAYAKNDKSNIERYNNAKALYYATANQLVLEGARNKDGSIFKVGDPLPKAYSNKESEGMKAIGDTMYGYYDSTKKSLMQGQFLGSLFMQMRTFWSGKKNQYLGARGPKAQGKWVPLKNELGEELYYSKNENGEIDQNLPLVPKSDPNSSEVQFLQWQGKFEEGALLTLWSVMKKAYHRGSVKDMFNGEILNELSEGNEDVRKTLISNLKLILTDFIMLILIGSIAAASRDWADKQAKEAKKSEKLEDALYATFAGLSAKTLTNSSLDFAWWNALFEPSMDWNPFAVSYLGNEAKAILNFLTGDATAGQTFVKSFSAARQMKPMFIYLDQED